MQTSDPEETACYAHDNHDTKGLSANITMQDQPEIGSQVYDKLVPPVVSLAVPINADTIMFRAFSSLVAIDSYAP